DLTIKMDINAVANGQTHTMHVTTSIKGSKVRTETRMDPPPNLPPAFAAQFSGVQSILIADTKTGQRVMLMPARKMKITLPSTQPSANPANAQAPAANQFVATGKTDTVNGYAVAEYTDSDPQHPLSIWAAKDYPNADTIRSEMKSWMDSAQRQNMPSLDQVPGIPLKIEVKSPPGSMMPLDMTMVVSSISTDPVSDDLFNIPDDYQDMPTGGFGGPGMAPPGAGNPQAAPPPPPPGQ
ncbi:MAG TPA: DUF4412 domain-containing protein, partial [Tepidisphaeraceae bacterium]|nr:DUF4412 domain-containing protein [Tepidisphaeraceae bacterium]